MKINEMEFHRVFSKTMYKNLKLPLAEMTFTKDFISDKRGDLYPIIKKSDSCLEKIEHNCYQTEGGKVERLVCAFFPYATYEVTFLSAHGACGFNFVIHSGNAKVIYKKGEIVFSTENENEVIPCTIHNQTTTMIVSCRPGAFDIYIKDNNKPCYLHTFETDIFENSHSQTEFQKGYVTLAIENEVTVTNVESYIDCGISQADIRPIRYENGDVIFENGKIFLTLSIRMQEKMFQGIVSWVPSTSLFELTGALFYDTGDGKLCGDVAASILYNRKSAEWYLWVCSFNHGHILGHASFKGDPRFGINVIDITLMGNANAGDDFTTFAAFTGDEDPDFYFSEKENRWYMAICRKDPSTKSYRYVFFASAEPFASYEYIGKGLDGAETGGSFISINGEKIFACGNDFNKRANYRIYTKDGMTEAKFDFDDGGFRGWGTIIPIDMGSRKKYYWLTFDRHGGSDYNWSYGNIYCFESC